MPGNRRITQDKPLGAQAPGYTEKRQEECTRPFGGECTWLLRFFYWLNRTFTNNPSRITTLDAKQSGAVAVVSNHETGREKR